MDRLLIVDDEPGILEIVEFMIQDAGFDTATASNGTDAFKMIETGNFDCIVTDIKMPGGDGLELLEKVYAAKGNTLPVILMSGHVDFSAMNLSKKGAYGFMPKPLDFKKLLATIQNAVAQKKKLTAAP